MLMRLEMCCQLSAQVSKSFQAPASSKQEHKQLARRPVQAGLTLSDAQCPSKKSRSKRREERRAWEAVLA